MTDQANQDETAIIMELWAKDRDDLIASFRWSPDNGGKTTVTFAKEDFAPLLQQFISMGLGEWVDQDGTQTARVTLSNDAYFLPHLAAYIRKMNGMRTTLSWNGRSGQG